MNLSQFQNNRVPVLVVTDVAARGLDIPAVNTGRTARGGKDGATCVFVGASCGSEA